MPQSQLETTPFTILCDSREQHPYQFQNFFVCRKRKGGKVQVPLDVLVESRGLPTGDYSIDGWEDKVAVERKSLEDLYQTLSWGRERFVREMQRLNELQVAWVVVESDWQYVLNPPRRMMGDRPGMSPSAVYHTILSWQSRYSKVHWLLCPTRRFAEESTFHCLNHFWLLHRTGGKLEREMAG